MENSTLPTAKEFLRDNAPCSTEGFMIEFARMHVKVALGEASNNFTMKQKDNIEELHMNDEWMEVDKDSILQAYPLNNIK